MHETQPPFYIDGMTTPEAPDAIDTRVVLRAYAVLVSLAGFTLLAWGPMWLGTSLAGNPYGKALLIRLCGGVVLAAGCSAAGFAQIDDSTTRHRALLWFLLAHVMLLAIVASQLLTIGIPGPGDVVFYSLCAALILLFYFWQTDGYRAWDMFRQTPPAPERLRSEYEERIREAAGQEERNRLARDLHDSIKQQIFVMQTSAATAQARFGADPAGTRAALEQLRDAARDAMIEMEAMLDNLRAAPLENVGLIEALKKQCEALGLRTGMQVQCVPGDLPPSESLAPGAQQAIFRVAQEALANIGRHARARSVRVTLERRGRQVVLEIIDDGTGFEPGTAPQGMGLRNMQARAAALHGRLVVQSRPGGGTCVELSVPHTVRRDVAAYRRRVIVWASMMALFIVRVVVEVALFKRLMTTWVDLMYLLVTGVIFLRALVSYRRARNPGEIAPCLESPSRS
jgi:signal transduction histidine kinase